MNNYNCIVVLGPTASGKTRLACQLAYYFNGEIISADSRQVYKGLDIGTGKDLQEYTVNGLPIKYHLIDVCNPGEQFYLHQYIELQEKTFNEITSAKHLPIICGGTGLYLDTLHKNFDYTQVKENHELRSQLEKLNKEQLQQKLKQFPVDYTSHADLSSTKRLIRAIEVATFLQSENITPTNKKEKYNPLYVAVDVSLEERRNLISQRLKQRLEHGLIEEAEGLIKSGVSHDRLQFFGLEYKFVSYYLLGQITKEELFNQLQTAIFQFAKRQMTWFRKMEKEGIKIHWFQKTMPSETIITVIKELIQK